MAILGRSILPPLQAPIMGEGTCEIAGAAQSAIRASFVKPLICFAVGALFGRRTMLAQRQPAVA